MSGRFGVAVVGTGRAGMVHARNFAAGVAGGRLVALADPIEEAVATAARETGCKRTYADPSEAIAADDVDAVVVASPTFTHAELAVAALAAGKHVLCEKPLASTLEEAAAIARAVDESEASFLMGFMRRFDTTWSSVAERVAAGEIGEPLLVRSTGRGPSLPPQWALDPGRSGGLIAEVNSHDIDSIRWFSGEEFETVYAVGRASKRPDLAERYPGFVDLVLASFELSGGALGELDGACPADYGYDARVEIYGSEGVAFAGDPRRGSALLIRRGEAVAEPVLGWRDLFAAAYCAEDAHLVGVARGEAEPRTNIDDGIRALEAVFAVNLSLAERAPVTLARAAAA
jgi:predicted dehydrogenase